MPRIGHLLIGAENSLEGYHVNALSVAVLWGLYNVVLAGDWCADVSAWNSGCPAG